MRSGRFNSVFIVILLVGIVFVLVNLLADRTLVKARVDLTEQQLYTLSDGTKNILHDLDEPVNLKFYYSKSVGMNYPHLHNYANRVLDMLEEYRYEAAGKITLTVLDPEPFSEEEDRALAYGLEGVPVGDTSQQLYFGLVGTNSTDAEKHIAFFQNERESLLEYDLSKLIYELTEPEKPKVAMLSSLPIAGNPSLMGQGAPSWIIYDQLQQFFDVQMLGADLEKIDETIRLLLLIHPKDLSEVAQYAIDQFVMRGGRVIAFVDPYSEAELAQQQTMGPPDVASDPGRLLKAWGVKLGVDVVGDLESARQVRIQHEMRNQVIEYPLWIDLTERHYNPGDVVTTRLGDMTLASPGRLSHIDAVQTDFVPLLHTGPNASTFSTSDLGMFMDVYSMVTDYQPQGEYVLAARVSGKLKSAFPEGAPDTDDEVNPFAEHHLAETQEDASLVVIADTDFLQDRFWLQAQNFLGQRVVVPYKSNGDFVLNLMDQMSGSADLIQIRNRGVAARPFTLIEEIQKQAEKRFRSKEQELLVQLQQTEQELEALQGNQTGVSEGLFSDEQMDAIERFRQDKIRIRKDLRDVQHQLQKDIQSLETTYKLFVIWLVPGLVIVAGIFYAFYSARKKRQDYLVQSK